MHFYENYVRLCNSIGKTPSAVAKEIGIQKSTVTRWKEGRGRTDATLQKVADYFGVTKESLINEIIYLSAKHNHLSEATALIEKAQTDDFYAKLEQQKSPTDPKVDEAKSIEYLLDQMSQADLVELMGKVADKLKERGLE